MRLVIQKVSSASCEVDSKIISEIKKGYVILVGIDVSDTLDDVKYLAKKVANLRIFEDDCGKLNLNIEQVQGSILSISQFTLLAQTKKGNRPSFDLAAKKELSFELYEAFNRKLNDVYHIETFGGKFGSYMKIKLENDGPVTIIMDSHES